MAGYSKKDLEEIGRILKNNEESTAKMESSLNGYLASIKAIGQEKLRIKHLEEQQVKLAQELLELEIETQRLKDERIGKTGAELVAAQATYKASKGNLKLLQGTVAANNANLKTSNTSLKTLTQIANQANIASLAYNEMGQAWNKLPGLAQKFYGHIKGLEALEMSKEVKRAELSMGILSNQSKFFGKSMATASQGTQQLGVSVSDLAIAQRGYADEIGRGVMLTEDEMQAMAEIGKGTMLGMDGAVGMAAAMENFGLSATAARDGVQETVDIAHKMGVNANSAIKELGKALKLAQKYHFKGGVNGMASMASYAAAMKMDMGGMASMADKAFRPEGAVEMAARLATMGGDMAKLGDPFVLMFKARNDFEGFARDMGDATAEFAQLNKETGEFDITGLQLDRIKEIGEITGVGAENMAEMSKQAAKFNMAKSMVNFDIPKEDREMISKLATFDKDSGQWMVGFDGKKQLLKDMKAADLVTYRSEEKSLKERAEQAQTFDETFNNLVMQFKTMALPFIEALNSGLVQPMIKFQEQMKGSEFLENVKNLGESLGKFIGVVGGFVLDFPKLSLAIAAGGTIFFNMGKWFANGVALAKGFNLSAKGFTSPGGALAAQTATGVPMSSANRMLGGNVMGGKLAAGTMGSMAAGAGLGIAGMGLSYGGDKLKESGHEGLGSAAKIAGSAASGAGMGMMLGPWGAAIGGLLGLAYGAYNEYSDKGQVANQKVHSINDGIIKFNPQDKFLQMNDGIVASTDKGKIDDIAKTSKSGGSGGKITFGDLNIKGTIKVDIDNGGEMNIDLTKDPFFIREITKLIQEQLRTDIGGGKLSPNPM